MDSFIPFTDENFLNDIKVNFHSDLLQSYKKLGDIELVKREIQELFKSPNVKESEIRFVYEPLLLGSDDDDELTAASENVKRVYESLKVLTPSQAAMEKIWVALLNTYYLDYHLHVIRHLQGKKEANQLIYDRTFLKGPVHSEKRRMMMNNLALLWWIGHYTHDQDNSANPYHLTEFFMSTPYRGNAVAFFSSNIHGNRNITLGILDAIKFLVDEGFITINRYAYTNSSKLVNLISGVKLVDLMTRADIKQFIINELPSTENIQLIKE